MLLWDMTIFYIFSFFFLKEIVDRTEQQNRWYKQLQAIAKFTGNFYEKLLTSQTCPSWACTSSGEEIAIVRGRERGKIVNFIAS